MATRAIDRGDQAGFTPDNDRRFFAISAVLMALVLVGGFSTQLAFGRSSFAVPALFHVHAVVFFGWVALYVTQTLLAARGSLALHRRLGWLAAGWIPAMTVLAVGLVVFDIRTRGAPFFFDQNQFLFGNTMSILSFAALAIAALVLRRRSDWHRRLLFCGMAVLTGPGFGRLLPLPLLIPWSWWISAFAAPVLFPLAGIVADLRRTGRIHPAWWWGLGVMTGALLIGDVIAYSPVGYAMTQALIEGMPGSARPIHAFVP